VGRQGRHRGQQPGKAQACFTQPQCQVLSDLLHKVLKAIPTVWSDDNLSAERQHYVEGNSYEYSFFLSVLSQIASSNTCQVMALEGGLFGTDAISASKVLGNIAIQLDHLAKSGFGAMHHLNSAQRRKSGGFRE